MKRKEYFLDFEKLETFISDEYTWFTPRDKAAFKYEFLKQTYFMRQSTSFKYPVMLYLCKKKFSMKYELEDILTLIKNGAAKAETDYYRKHFKEYEINPQKQQFLNSLKSFTPCGIFYHRKTRIEIRQLNCIVMLQNIYEELSNEQLQQIKDDKLTFAVFSLLDTNRYAVLVKVQGINSKNYRQFQQYVEDYYRTLLKAKVLVKVEMNTVVYLASDERFCINMQSSIILSKI
jgi:hypothetical protein